MVHNFLNSSKSIFMLCLFSVLFQNGLEAQVTLIESTTVTDEALFFWKADDPTPYHYGAAINPHGNCVKVVNGYVFYTWYKGGFSDRTLMVSRKKIGEGTWIHVALPGKMSLVGGKGDTHLTTNIGICPVDGTVHIMYDHHNEDLNYIRSKKNIAFAADADFIVGNFLPQQDYLVEGTKVTGVTYPDMFNNDDGEMLFVRRSGSAVGGNILTSYYDGTSWSDEIKMFQGTGAEVAQGQRHFCYGKSYNFNGSIYYSYSIRWAESPTVLNEGIYLANVGPRMNQPATTVNERSFSLPVRNHDPFLIADPRSVPATAGWAGGPNAAISPKNDIYMKISPKNTTHYNYFRKAGETEFTEDRGKGDPGMFYGNRMFKATSSNGLLSVQSCAIGTYEWRTDFQLETGIDVQKSQVKMENGKIVAIYAERKSSDKVPIHCYVFNIVKPEYLSQVITFDALSSVSESSGNFSLSATASSGLPVSFTSSNQDLAKIIDGNKVQIVGVGSCNIIASQAGDGEYDSAEEVSQTLVVSANTSKTNQTISFTLEKTTHTWGDADVNLHGTASSGLAVQYESSDTNVAVIVNDTLHVKRAGSTIIRALQPGNDIYNAAPVVKDTLIVPKRTQLINFEAIPELNSGAPTYTLVASSNNPNAKLNFVCPNNQVAIVWGNTITETLAAGSATVTVSDIGDDYFEEASAQQTITVKPTTFSIPAKIEAEWCTSKQGVNVTRWSNSVFYLNAWGANDYAEYSINVPQAGKYPMDVHAANPNGSGKVKIMAGSTELATVSLVPSNSLTIFKTTSTEVELTEGIHNIRIVATTGGFNFDWIRLKEIIVPLDTTRILSFKNISNGQEIELGSNLTIEANVGSAFKEVSLWSDDTNIGTLSNAPYQWSSHAILTDMREASYNFKLVAKDSNDVAVETSIIIFTPAVDELSNINSLHISFEDEAIQHWETDGNDYGVTPAIIDGTNTRAGIKVMALEYPGGTSGHHVQNIMDKIVVPDQYYFHLIAYTATSDIAIGKTFPTGKLGDWAPTPTFTGHSEALIFERKITSRQNTTGDSLNCYPRLRSKAFGGACVVYYDDIVLYSDMNSVADLTPPDSAENIIFTSQAANNLEISWTEGVDSESGVNATLVLRTSNPSATPPEMKAQVAYSTVDDATSIAVLGDWTVIASLPGGITNYTDNVRSEGASYKYALVHKDLAYNYSIPVIGVEDITVVAELENLTFKCYGGRGSILLKDMEPGRTVSIFTITGAKVFEQNTINSSMSIPALAGIYIVAVSGEVAKVIVK